VKPSHIFFGEAGQAKLGDFGLSKAMSTNTQIAFSFVGTPFYMSPEIVRDRGYSFGSDLWSLGCSMYELAVSYPPFYRGDMNFYALGDAICSGRYPALSPEVWSKEFIDLIGKILTVEPAFRPSAQSVLDDATCKLVRRIHDFETLGTIGRGNFSEVHRSLWKVKDHEVALKRVQIYEMTRDARQECEREVDLLKAMNHPTIIRYFASFFENSELIVVLELAAHGDLAHLCRQMKTQKAAFMEEQVWAIFIQVSDALDYMHKRRIMHRDIKPGNVFLFKDGIVKLGDLGLGRYFSSNTYRTHSVVGTPFYMAPEVITGIGGYSFKSDVWSLGCVLYELAVLSSPFASAKRLNYYTLGNSICTGEYTPLPEKTSPRVTNLCGSMIRVDAESRPDARAVFVAAYEHFSFCSQDVVEDMVRAENSKSDAGRAQRQLLWAAAIVKALHDSRRTAQAKVALSDLDILSCSLPVSAAPAAPTVSVSPTAPAAHTVPAAPTRNKMQENNRIRDQPTPARGVSGERLRRTPQQLARDEGPLVPPAPAAVRKLELRRLPGSQRGASRDRDVRVGGRYASTPPNPTHHRWAHTPGSQRGTSRDRDVHVGGRRASTPPNPTHHRWAHTPPGQISHLRFAGGAMSEGWKSHQSGQPACCGLPPIQPV